MTVRPELSPRAPATGRTVSRRHQGLALALFWVLLVSVYGATISSGWKTPDVISAEAGSWRIAHTGEPWVDGIGTDRYVLQVDLDSDVPGTRMVLFSTHHADNGHAVISRTPGAIAAGIPAYWIQSLFDQDSGEDLSAVPGALTAAFLAATTVLLLLLAVRDLLPFRALLAAGGAIAFTTPYWSVLADALWSHGVTTLGIAGMAWAARRERWWLVGIFGGVGLWGRMHVVLIVAMLGVGVALWRRKPTIALTVAATSLPFLGAAFVWGHWMYGAWSVSAATGGYGNVDRLSSSANSLGVSNMLGYLISPGAGLFVWTPVLLVLLPAVVRQWRATPDWVRILACAGILYLLAQASLNRFHGGNGFWGNRLGLETLTCLIPLVVCSLVSVRAWERTVAIGALAYQGGVILLGAAFDLSLTDGHGWHDYDPYLAFRDNPAVTTIVLLVGAGVVVATARVLLRPGHVEDAKGQLRAEPAT